MIMEDARFAAGARKAYAGYKDVLREDIRELERYVDACMKNENSLTEDDIYDPKTAVLIINHIRYVNGNIIIPLIMKTNSHITTPKIINILCDLLQEDVVT
jgi:hypothetical protein